MEEFTYKQFDKIIRFPVIIESFKFKTAKDVLKGNYSTERIELTDHLSSEAIWKTYEKELTDGYLLSPVFVNKACVFYPKEKIIRIWPLEEYKKSLIKPFNNFYGNNLIEWEKQVKQFINPNRATYLEPEDYDSDLTVRDEIEEQKSLLSANELKRLKETDEKFRKICIPINNPFPMFFVKPVKTALGVSIFKKYIKIHPWPSPWFISKEEVEEYKKRFPKEKYWWRYCVPKNSPYIKEFREYKK